MSKQILVVNTIFTSKSGNPTAVACRIRGEANGKTLKVSPHLFKKGLPIAEEAVYAEFEDSDLRESGNYRVLSNAKIWGIGSMESTAAFEQADEAVAAVEEVTEAPF